MRGGGILASLVLLAGATGAMACEEPVNPNYAYGPGYYGPAYYGPGYYGPGYAYGPWPRPYYSSAPIVIRPHFHHHHFHHHHH